MRNKRMYFQNETMKRTLINQEEDLASHLSVYQNFQPPSVVPRAMSHSVVLSVYNATEAGWILRHRVRHTMRDSESSSEEEEVDPRIEQLQLLN